jgi:LysM repeat protein
LWQIAAHYETTLQELLLLNSLDEDDFIQPGDEIWVRLAEGAPPPPTPTPPLVHTVREGENPWIIANRYNIDIDTFFYLNSLDEFSLLHPGNEVRIRVAEGEAPPPTPTPKLAHIVREGDTLWSIAAQNGLEMEQLLAFNGLVENAILQVGDELFIRATETPLPSPTPDVTTTPTPQTPNIEQQEVEGAPALAMAAVVDTPQPSPTPTVVTTPEPRPSRGAGLLYTASLLLAGAGLILFVGVVLRKA